MSEPNPSKPPKVEIKAEEGGVEEENKPEGEIEGEPAAEEWYYILTKIYKNLQVYSIFTFILLVKLLKSKCIFFTLLLPIYCSFFRVH